MKTLYLDCGMGAAGDMISAALLELYPDLNETVKKLNALGIPGVVYTAEKTEKHSISGTHLTVSWEGETEGHDHHGHHHMHVGDIKTLINGLDMPQSVKANACGVYDMLAEAEARVHGCPMENIHFHELGTMDAVADITAACFLIDGLGVNRVLCSPVRLGYGEINCAHGVLPVPAPATAELLKGVTVFAGDIEGEMCTPTGAALIKHFARDFCHMPEMTVTAVGRGMGARDYGRANCLTATLGESSGETATELLCNVDDMTPEAVGFAMDILRKSGALDVCWQPVGMKKDRPGMLLRVLCRGTDRDNMVKLIFRHTSTIGIRETLCARNVLKRSTEYVETPWGSARIKISEGYDVRRVKPEFDDIAALAAENGVTFEDVKAFIMGGQKNA